MTHLVFSITLLVAAAAGAQTLTAEQRERCAIRLAANVLGTTPTPALLAATDPRNEVPNLLADPVFIDKFAAYINSRFAPEPTVYQTQETPYWLAKKVLAENRKWKEMFIGPFVFARQTTDTNGVMAPVITVDAVNGGYGYTQSTDWRTRYRGNELEGYRLVHAYRLINNALGTELKAALNTNGVSSEGRKSAQCSGCHYHPMFGLDLIARVLPRRTQSTTTSPPYDAPQTLMGQTITDEKAFLQALVASPDFKFNVCRTAMRFAYGRPEYKCEGPVFDACLASFNAQETMQSALSAVLRHPTYCQ